MSDRLSDLHLITLLANVTWFGPNRFAADMREIENLIFGDLGGFLETFCEFLQILTLLEKLLFL